VVISADPGTSIAVGQAVTLSAQVTGAGPSVKYQWLLNTDAVAGATSARYTGSEFSDGDVISCTVTGICGVVAGDHKVVIRVGATGTQQVVVTGGDIRVVPNPNKGVFTVRGSLGVAADAEVTLEITDVLGQGVYKGTVLARNGELDEKIQLAGSVANGMYLLNVQSGSEHKVFHIVIEQ
jgi:Secretion system C-terminal sorting domain